ncbi:unnamed protein product, partial [Allacma fusca]
GTTPLILAARLAIEGMVENLITAQADINAADNNGKTALHWAAAVNNMEAVQILLNHNANKDAQDERDETALFLAAREGSRSTCKILLDHHCNRDIADHMDRLPRDVAQERFHHDIVRLLDEHVPRPTAVQSMHHHQNSTSSNHNGSVGNGISNQNQMGVTSASLSSFQMNSQSGQQQQVTAPKPKKRTTKQQDKFSSDDQMVMAPKTPRRPASRKKKSADSLLNGMNSVSGAGGAINHGMLDNSPMSSADSSTMSPPEHIPQYQQNHHNGGMYQMPQASMAISQPNLSSLNDAQGMTFNTLHMNKAPPPYEDCMKSMSIHNLHYTSNYSAQFNGSQQQPPQQHQQPQYLQNSSPFPSPQSVASHFTPSPNSMSYAGSPPSLPPQCATSPNKRPSLPTSPTHIKALRTAHQNRHGSQMVAGSGSAFDYPPANSNNSQQFYTGPNAGNCSTNTNGNLSHYPTPPSQHSSDGTTPPQHYTPDSYPTPSPESPGQWSSSSPHSNSDWSEGIQSPGHIYNSHGQPMQLQFTHTNSRAHEGIFI